MPSCLMKPCLIAVCLFTVFSITVVAQTPSGWVIDVEPLYMNVKGFDQHSGDVVQQTVTFATNPPRVTDLRTRQPITNTMNAGTRLLGGIQYRRQGWSGGANAWWFTSNDQISGRVTSPGALGPSSFAVNTVSMWNETLVPVENDLEPSGFSPVDFRSQGRLRTYALDFFAFRPLTGDASSNRIDLILGTKVGYLKTSQNQGFTERAFVFDYFQFGSHLNNVITLGTDAEARFVGIGPLIGIQAETKWGYVTIQPAATMALLIGNARQKGLATDTDEITVAQSPLGPFLTCPVSLVRLGCLPVHSEIAFSTSPRTFVPVTELRLKLEVKLTNHIAVGGSGFTAIWSSAPIPPAYTITHADAGPGLNWQLQHETLRFAGAGVAFTVNF